MTDEQRRVRERELELVRLAQSGDEVATSTLYYLYIHAVNRTLVSLLYGTPALLNTPEDLADESFLKALAGFRKPGRSFRPFFAFWITIARNGAISERRRRESTQRADREAAHDPPDRSASPFDKVELIKVLWSAHEIIEDHYTPFDRRWFDDWADSGGKLNWKSYMADRDALEIQEIVVLDAQADGVPEDDQVLLDVRRVLFSMSETVVGAVVRGTPQIPTPRLMGWRRQVVEYLEDGLSRTILQGRPRVNSRTERVTDSTDHVAFELLEGNRPTHDQVRMRVNGILSRVRAQWTP